MKLLLLGATGRTGKLVLDEALHNNYGVVCLVRDSSKIRKRTGLEIIQGDVTNPRDLAKAIEGCRYVISTLNISRKTDFPWSPLRTPKTLLSDTMRGLISLEKTAQLERVVTCSAWGVAETKNDIPGWFRWLIDNSNIKHAYEDHQKQEELLTNSGHNWIIVRPTGLTNTNKSQEIKLTEQNQPKPNLTISRKSTAKFLVQCLTNDDLLRSKVTVSKA